MTILEEMDKEIEIFTSSKYLHFDRQKELIKYLITPCMLKICKTSSGDFKYCYLVFDGIYKPKTVSSDRALKGTALHSTEHHDRNLFYYSGSRNYSITPRSLNITFHESWYDFEREHGSVSEYSHDSLRKSSYLSDHELYDMKRCYEHLKEYHLEMLLKQYENLSSNIEKAKEKSIKGKERGKLKSAVTFTKSEQAQIIISLYNAQLNKLMEEVEAKLSTAFGAPFQFKYTNLTFTSESPLLKLINSEPTPKLSPSGKELYEELLKTNYDIPALLEDWYNSEDPVHRRFALTFSNKPLVFGLLDQDEKIRLSAEIKFKEDKEMI